ncbi:unnamed protein product [Didymodactylos carnosus]|uniref:Uncharacterized protein n=1 Tax=Didymodactylos carnosus TaxID=1234261 RepID=A0A8S2WAK3_9BILA|nr:unnamed protein product [Didymodactylos carnosus]CAF4441561.1 unnamed protein product [Didymodactylos carnosus]
MSRLLITFTGFILLLMIVQLSQGYPLSGSDDVAQSDNDLLYLLRRLLASSGTHANDYNPSEFYQEQKGRL